MAGLRFNAPRPFFMQKRVGDCRKRGRAVRIHSHASDQYRKNSVLAEKPREKKCTQALARVKTTSFGFRLGKFGMDFQSRSTVLDPSLSHDVRERRQQARSFEVEAEVESLRARVGVEGAAYREGTAAQSPTKPSRRMIRTAMAAYTRSTEKALPLPGNMLASVV